MHAYFDVFNILLKMILYIGEQNKIIWLTIVASKKNYFHLSRFQCGSLKIINIVAIEIQKYPFIL